MAVKKVTKKKPSSSKRPKAKKEKDTQRIPAARLTSDDSLVLSETESVKAQSIRVVVKLTSGDPLVLHPQTRVVIAKRK